MEQATPSFLRRRFGLRVFIAEPVCSIVFVPAVAAYLIDNAHLSFVVAGGGVTGTGFMVYAEMYWVLRKINEKILEIDNGTHDISFNYSRLDSIRVIFDTVESRSSRAASGTSPGHGNAGERDPEAGDGSVPDLKTEPGGDGQMAAN